MYAKAGAKDANLLSIFKRKMSRKRKFFICVFFAAVIMVGASVFQNSKIAPPPVVDTNAKIVSTIEKPTSGSPADYSAYENFCIAAGVLYDSPSFEAITDGTVTASVFGAPYNQYLTAQRVKIGDRIFHTMISTSTMKSIGEQRFFAGDTILMRKGKYKMSKLSGWGDIGLVSVDEFSQLYGFIPREICPYIINESTFLEGGFVSSEDGLSTYYLILDPETAPERYKRQVATLGGANKLPQFKSIKLTFTIDDQWIIKQHTVQEEYFISIPGLGDMNCKSTVTDTFNIDGNLDFPEDAQPFLNLAPGSVGDLDTSTEMGEADYLAAAFGEYLGGKPLSFSANINALGASVPLEGYLDLSAIDIRLSIGDLLYVVYKDGTVYIRSGEGKIKIETSELTPLLEELKPLLDGAGIDLDNISSMLGGDDILAVLFENSSIKEDGDDIHILMPFSLMGLNLDIDMHLSKDGDSYSPVAIKADIDLSSLGLDKYITTADGQYVLNVDLNIEDVSLPEPDESYKKVDLSYIPEFITSIKSLILANGYNIGGTVVVDGTEIEIDALIIRGETLKDLTLSADICVMGITANVKLIGGVIYVQAGNVKLQAAVSELPELIKEISALIPNGEKVADGVDAALELIRQIKEIKLPLDFSGLLGMGDGNLETVKSSVASVLAFLPTLEYKGGALNIDINGIKASIRPESNKISVDLPSLTLKDTTIGASVSLEGLVNVDPIDVDEAQSYIAIEQLYPFIEPIAAAINAGAYDFNGNVSIGGTVITLSATLVRGDDISLSAQIDVMGISADIKLVDGVIYISAGNIMLKAAISDFPTIMDEIGALIPSGDDLLASLSETLPILEKLSDIKNIQIADILSELYITVPQSGKLHVCIFGITADIAVEADNKISLELSPIELNIPALSEKNISIAASVSLRSISEEIDPITVDNADSYVSAVDLLPYIAPIKALVCAESFKLNISNGLIENDKIKEILKNTNVSGDLFVNLGTVSGNGLSFAAALKAFSHDLNFTFDGETAYIAVNEGIKLSLNIDNLQDILQKINELYATDGDSSDKVDVDLIMDYIDKIKALDLGSLVKFDEASVKNILGMIRSLSYGNDGLTAVISAGDFTVTATVAKPSGAGALCVDLVLNYAPASSAPIDISLTLTLSDFSDMPIDITVANEESYVASNDIVEFIDPVLNTINQQKFYVTFDAEIAGKNEDGSAKTTYISGELKIIPTSEISQASFPEMYLSLSIGTNKKSPEHTVMLLINKTESGEVHIYANYNDMKIHLSYTAALKIIGSVCDILNLHIPMIDNLTNGVYTEEDKLDTSLFADANMAGVTEKLQELNGIFNVVDGGESAFDALMDKLLYGALDEALKSISISLGENGLEIGIENSLLEHIMAIVNGTDTQTESSDLGKASLSVSHENNLLKKLSISNLAVNGNKIAANVELKDVQNVTLPKPTDKDFSGYMDFDSLYEFLQSVINTANTRMYPITGTIGINALSLAKAEISFNLNVAVIDNPSYDKEEAEADPNYSVPKTKVLVGLKIWNNLSPGLNLTSIAITKRDSYLYFDGDYIYIQKDDYESKYKLFSGYYWALKSTVRYKITPDEFSPHALDIIYDLIPLSDFVKSKIPTDSESNSGNTNYGHILTAYEKKGSSTSLTVNLQELAGSNMLSDLNITFDEKAIDGKKYLQKFSGNTRLAGVVKADFAATLKSVNENNLTRGLDPIEFGYNNGQTQTSVDYTQLVGRLNSLFWDTFENTH